MIWSKLVASVLKRVALVVVSLVTGPKVGPVLAGLGITVDPLVAQAGVYAVLEAVRNYAKHKLGLTWL